MVIAWVSSSFLLTYIKYNGIHISGRWILYYKKWSIIVLFCFQAVWARGWAQKTASTTMPKRLEWSQQNNKRKWGGSLAIQHFLMNEKINTITKCAVVFVWSTSSPSRFHLARKRASWHAKKGFLYVHGQDNRVIVSEYFSQPRILRNCWTILTK